MVEVELKLAVPDAAAFARLLAALPPPTSVVDQLNAYVDTPGGDVGRRREALRLRVGVSFALWTLKGPRVVTGGVHSAPETEVPCDRRAAVAWLRGEAGPPLPRGSALDAVAGVLDAAGAVVVAWSLTRRTACPLGHGMVAELDESAYADGFMDYEIEVEHPDPAAAMEAVRRLGAEAGVTLAPSVTKRVRAVEHRVAGAAIPIPGTAGTEGGR